MIETHMKLRESEIPSRAAFLLECAERNLVSEHTLERLAKCGTLVSMEQAIDEAIVTFGASISLRKNAFTKSAKRQLKSALKGNQELHLDPQLVVEIMDSAMESGLLSPDAVMTATRKGRAGISEIVAFVTAALNKRLPGYLELQLNNDSYSIIANDLSCTLLKLPTDTSPESHALRMAVSNALEAISAGIACFSTLQSSYSIDGCQMYVLSDSWEFFKPMVDGKSAEQIAALLENADRSTWDFEPYYFNVDDPVEFEPGQKPFNDLVDTLYEISQFQSKYAIDDRGYRDDFDATCAAQISIIEGQAGAYPQHASVYAVVLEALQVARNWQDTNSHASAICRSQFISEDSSTLENIDIMDAVIAQMVEPMPNLDELLMVNLEDTFQNVGLPHITAAAAPGVFSEFIMPLIATTAEAGRLITQIQKALENTHAR